MRLDQRSHARANRAIPVGIAAACLWLSGCKVISIAENEALRERASATFNAERYGETVWTRQALPYWSDRETSLDALRGGIQDDLPATGEAQGRRAGDGSPWTFVVTGRGVVQSIGQGPRGRVVVALDGGGEATLQVGPAISGSALRDSLPFIRFDDFSNQLVYADVSAGLNGQAVRMAAPVVASLGPGEPVSFAGVLAVAEPGDALVVTPYRLTAGSGA